MAKRIATLIALFVLISCSSLTKAESKGESIRNYNPNEDNIYAQEIPYSRNKEREQSAQYQPVNYSSKDDYSAHQNIYSSPPIPTYQQVSYIPESASQSTYQADAEEYKQPASYHSYSTLSTKPSDGQKKTVILAIPVKLALHVPETKTYGDRIKPSYNDGRSESFTPSTVYANEDERQENYHSTQTYNSNQAKSVEGSERPAYDSNKLYSQIGYKPQSYIGNQIYDNQPPTYVEEPKNGPTYQIFNKRPEIIDYGKEKDGLSILSSQSLNNVKDETPYIEFKSPIAYSQEVYQPNVAIVSKEKQYKDSTDNEPTYSNSPPKPTYYSSVDAYESDQDDWQNSYLRGKNTEESGEEYPNGETTSYQPDPDSYHHSFNKGTSKKVKVRPNYDTDDDFDGGSSGIEPYANSNGADSLEGDSSFESGTGIQIGDIKENKNSNNFGNNDGSFESFAISSEAGSSLGPFNSPSFPSGSSFSFRNSFGVPSYQGASGLSLTNPSLLFGNTFNGLPTDPNVNNINDATWANLATSSLQMPATNAAAYGGGSLDLSSLYGTLMRPISYPMMASTTGQFSSGYNQAANYQPISLATSLLYGKPVNLKASKLTFAAPSPLHVTALPLRVTKGSQQSGASKYRPSILASLYSSSTFPVKSYLGTNGKSIFGSGIGGGFRLSSVFKPSTFISPIKYTSALDNLLSQIYKLL